jgi:hypothetical protein
VPKNEHELASYPSLYSKFVEDKIISEQDVHQSSRAYQQQQQQQIRVSERDIK